MEIVIMAFMALMFVGTLTRQPSIAICTICSIVILMLAPILANMTIGLGAGITIAGAFIATAMVSNGYRTQILSLFRRKESSDVPKNVKSRSKPA